MVDIGGGIRISVNEIEGEQHVCLATPYGVEGSAVFDTRRGELKARGEPLAVLRSVIAVLHFELIFKELFGKESSPVEDVLKTLSRTSDAAAAEQVAMALIRRIEEVDGAPIDQTCEIKLFDDPVLFKMYAQHWGTGGLK